MVEGGAQIIKSFFNAPGVVDNLIITVAPTLVGDHGVGYDYQLTENFEEIFEHGSTNIVGRDTVMCMKARSS